MSEIQWFALRNYTNSKLKTDPPLQYYRTYFCPWLKVIANTFQHQTSWLRIDNSSLQLPNTRWERIQSHLVPWEESACAAPSTVTVRQHSSTGAVHRPLQTTHTHYRPTCSQLSPAISHPKDSKSFESQNKKVRQFRGKMHEQTLPLSWKDHNYSEEAASLYYHPEVHIAQDLDR